MGPATKDLKGGDGDGYMAAAIQTMRYGGGGAFEGASDVLRHLLQNATEKW